MSRKSSSTRSAPKATHAELVEHAGPWLRRKMLAAVKSLFSFAHKTGYPPYNVGAVLQLPRAKDDLAERELSEAEVHRMINLESNARNRILMLALYAGGLRREDITRLKWRDTKARDDLKPGAGQATIFGKGGKSGNVLLPPAVYRELLTLRVLDDGETLAERSAPIFQSRKRNTRRAGHLDVSHINRIDAAAARRAQIEGNVSPHWLRHSHATHAEKRGAKLSLIQKTLRHSSLETTGRYLHANPSESLGMYLGL